jgi:signal transduction histidine kinase
MEKCFLMDLVDAAARLVEEKGRDAFAVLRDKSGPFIFKNTYVFVDLPDGLELVNPAFPQLESVNMMDYKDSLGNYMVREYIRVALSRGSGWVTYMWPKPGETTPSPKFTYVKKSVHDKEVFIVGSGQYFE